MVAGPRLSIGPANGVVADGWVFPKPPAQVFASGEEQRVPLLVGNNSRERTPPGTPADLAKAMEGAMREMYGPLATRAFALELAPHGIRVNAVAPGVTTTGMNASVRADPERAEALTAAIPLGRMATPEEQAAGICFLASPDAGYITGATLPIDGGWLTR